MFDASFFLDGRFLDAVHEFGREQRNPDLRGDVALRVELVMRTGDRLDTMQIEAVDTGARLLTRDDRRILAPYEQIAYIDVSVLQDHRLPGFRTSTSSERE